MPRSPRPIAAFLFKSITHPAHHALTTAGQGCMAWSLRTSRSARGTPLKAAKIEESQRSFMTRAALSSTPNKVTHKTTPCTPHPTHSPPTGNHDEATRRHGGRAGGTGTLLPWCRAGLCHALPASSAAASDPWPRHWQQHQL